jgi:hypothetical protein
MQAGQQVGIDLHKLPPTSYNQAPQISAQPYIRIASSGGGQKNIQKLQMMRKL